MDLQEQIQQQAQEAKAAARGMALVDTETKNKALRLMGQALVRNSDHIIEENARDMEQGRSQGLSQALLDRLMLNHDRIQDMASGLQQVASLKDPIGQGLGVWTGADGIQITQIRTPMGVVGIIYEARPNVTADAVALNIKAGNSTLLKGGSEAIRSNTAIAGVLRLAAVEAGLPKGCIQFITSTDREAVQVMMKLNRFIDVLIPRGGAGLIKTVVENSSVPVIETGVGNCHLYVDESANPVMAENITINGKTQRPGVCNAVETLLVHRSFAAQHLSGLGQALLAKGVELRGCEETRHSVPQALPAMETDWETEFLDLILAVKVVGSLDEAIDHISRYSTGHSEGIITENYSHARRFQREIDAAAVYVNASTRYTDGHQFGFGAEIGISTQKLHARGPMGLEALTSVKYLVSGNGQVRR